MTVATQPRARSCSQAVSCRLDRFLAVDDAVREVIEAERGSEKWLAAWANADGRVDVGRFGDRQSRSPDNSNIDFVCCCCTSLGPRWQATDKYTQRAIRPKPADGIHDWATDLERWNNTSTEMGWGAWNWTATADTVCCAVCGRGSGQMRDLEGTEKGLQL
jgi:hypothetical protein